jgi:hypothetical protein
MHHTRLRDKNMKKNIMGMRLLQLYAAVTISVIILAGCTGNGLSQNNKSTISDDEPTKGWELSFSFPDGAPVLNQEAELLCSVDTDSNTRNISLNLRVLVDLPEALQLVSGNLTWEGIIVANPGEKIQTVKARVRSIKTGHYVIRIHGYLPENPPGGNFLPQGYGVFLSISNDKSEWGRNPPWALPPSMEPIPSDYPTPPTAEYSREMASPVP